MSYVSDHGFRRVALPFALAAAFVSLPACLWTARSETEQLKAQVGKQEQRIATLENALHSDLERAREKMKKLEQVLENATEVVTRNSADVTVRADQLQTQIAELEGQLAEIRNKLDVASKAPAPSAPSGTSSGTATAPPPPPQTAREQFAAAERAYEKGDYAAARSLFREFLTRFPKDEQADNAQYWMGASYLAQDRAATALGELRRVIEAYPSGDAVDKALFDMGEAFFRLHACADAKNALEALIRSHQKSPLAKKAKEKLRAITKAPKSQCKS